MSDALKSLLENSFDVPVIWDHDMSGGVDSKGEILQVWGERALRNSLKQWLGTFNGEILRAPNRAGFIMNWLTKPMTEVNRDDLSMAVRDAVDQDFSPALRVVRIGVSPNYSKRYWEIYLEVESVDLKVRTSVSAKIKAQV